MIEPLDIELFDENDRPSVDGDRARVAFIAHWRAEVTVDQIAGMARLGGCWDLTSLTVVTSPAQFMRDKVEITARLVRRSS